ncbi:MAG: hypothetical protein HRK26_03760 [Rickettsiaceae bacterium H1]|nr:hypothetical protein [Rickettsiaceae bacterium H1]
MKSDSVKPLQCFGIALFLVSIPLSITSVVYSGIIAQGFRNEEIPYKALAIFFTLGVVIPVITLMSNTTITSIQQSHTGELSKMAKSSIS